MLGSRYNQYMDNHLGIIIDNAIPYLEKIRRDKSNYPSNPLAYDLNQAPDALNRWRNSVRR